MTPCNLCHTFIHDTIETSLQEKFPAKFPRVKHLLGRIANDFRIALHECMGDRSLYKTMIQNVHNYIEFIGREKVLEAFIESVVPIRLTIRILEGELLDAGFGKLTTIQNWLRNMGLDLFMMTMDIHIEHSGERPPNVPNGQPTSVLPNLTIKKEDDPLYC